MITIREIKEEDLNNVVNVHNSAFPHFFLTELGHRFLYTYYKSVAESENGIVLGAFDEEKLIGFCAACTKSAGFNKSIIRENALSYILIGARILVRKPKAILRLIKNLTKTGNITDDGQYAELLSIAVAKGTQNSGAGKLLVNCLEDRLRRLKVSQLSLTTDKIENENTLQFYKKRGFKELYSFIAYPNRPMYRLIKNI